MKKTSVLVIAVIFALVSVFSLSGCDSLVVPEGEPDYESFIDSREMEIGGWIAPPQANWNNVGNINFNTQERYNEIAEAGLNSIIQIYFDWNTNTPGSVTMNALDYAQNAGVRLYVRHPGIEAMIEETVEEMQEFASNYRNHPAFAGHMIVDEPGANRFENLGIVAKKYKEAFPNKRFYINLFPTHAGSSRTDRDNYQDYIDEYFNEIEPDFISYDHYPLLEDAYGNYSITVDYLYNLEVIANSAKAHNVPFWNFLQSIKYDVNVRDVDLEELRWQVVSSMAYGISGIQYFCYWTPLEWGDNGNYALISTTGERTPMYTKAKTVNNEVKAYDHVYLSFAWQGTMPVIGTKNLKGKNSNFNMLKTPLSSTPRIKSITAEHDTLVGTFKDEDGFDGFMVVNYSDPGFKYSSRTEIQFNKASKAIIYNKGVKEVVNLENGKLITTIESGNGLFIIPIK